MAERKDVGWGNARRDKGLSKNLAPPILVQGRKSNPWGSEPDSEAPQGILLGPVLLESSLVWWLTSLIPEMEAEATDLWVWDLQGKFQDT